MKSTGIERLKDIFETAIESAGKYCGDFNRLDYYSLFCKAAENDSLYKLNGNNLCMFNCKIDEQDAMLMMFLIPINLPEESGAKNVAERVMEIVTMLEKCFITLDYLKSEEVKEDKYIYIVAGKKIGD